MEKPVLNWKNKSPIDMANRMVAADIIRTIGPKKIEMIQDQNLRSEFLLPFINEEGKEYSEIDWFFVMFQATEHQIGKLMDNFQPKEKKSETEKEKSIILDKYGK